MRVVLYLSSALHGWVNGGFQKKILKRYPLRAPVSQQNYVLRWYLPQIRCELLDFLLIAPMWLASFSESLV